MDFMFTDRPSSNVKPVWASSSDELSTPRKRGFSDHYRPDLIALVA